MQAVRIWIRTANSPPETGIASWSKRAVKKIRSVIPFTGRESALKSEPRKWSAASYFPPVIFATGTDKKITAQRVQPLDGYCLPKYPLRITKLYGRKAKMSTFFIEFLPEICPLERRGHAVWPVLMVL